MDSDSEAPVESDDDEDTPASSFARDFYVDGDGRVCLKADSALWEQVRFGNRLGANTAPAPVETSLPMDATSDRSHDSPTHPLPGKEREAPTQIQVKSALTNLENLLSPARKTGRGHTDPGLDPYVRKQIESMQAMLNFYVNPLSQTYDSWAASSLQAAISLGRGTYCARKLRKLNRQFIQDCTLLPVNPFGDWNESLLVDEDLTNDINLYLMEIGKEISAQKLTAFINRKDIRLKHGIEKPISERTARRYLNRLGYRWSTPKKGQYADGHERDDVVNYREQTFLPQWQKIEARMTSWTRDNLEVYGPKTAEKEVIVWFHDETIFYAHDRRKKGWYHKDASAKPYTKGEGATLMVTDFVSAKFCALLMATGQPDGS